MQVASVERVLLGPVRLIAWNGGADQRGHNNNPTTMRQLRIRVGKFEGAKRVRVGIGEEKIPEDWREFVLAEFPAALRPELDALIAKARDAVKAILAVGVERAMSRYNG